MNLWSVYPSFPALPVRADPIAGIVSRKAKALATQGLGRVLSDPAEEARHAAWLARGEMFEICKSAGRAGRGEI